MGPDREYSMVIEHKSDMAAKGAAILAKETLEHLKINEPVTTVAITASTVSKKEHKVQRQRKQQWVEQPW